MNRRPKLVLAVVGLLVAIAAPALAEKPKPLATFRAFAISMMGGGSGVVQIQIDRWTTDAERQSLLASLKAHGPDATLLKLMALPQVGFIKTPDSLGYALFYARQNQLPDGSRQVVLATDRGLTFGQMVRQPISNEYDYSLVEMHFPAKPGAKGEGKLVLAAKVGIDPKTGKFEMQNYQGEPPMLKDIEETQP
jgi:hypothetical protein